MRTNSHANEGKSGKRLRNLERRLPGEGRGARIANQDTLWANLLQEKGRMNFGGLGGRKSPKKSEKHYLIKEKRRFNLIIPIPQPRLEKGD